MKYFIVSGCHPEPIDPVISVISLSILPICHIDQCASLNHNLSILHSPKNVVSWTLDKKLKKVPFLHRFSSHSVVYIRERSLFTDTRPGVESRGEGAKI